MALRTTESERGRGGRQDTVREPVASRRALEPIAERVGACGIARAEQAGASERKPFNAARIPYNLADFAAKKAVEAVKEAVAKAEGERRQASDGGTLFASQTPFEGDLRAGVLRTYEEIIAKLQAELEVRERAAELTGKALEAIDAGNKQAAEAFMASANYVLDAWEKSVKEGGKQSAGASAQSQ